MRLIRLYEPQSLALHQQVQLGDFAAKHIAQVLRSKVGDKVSLFNGQGGEYHAIIEAIKKSTVTVTIIQFDARDCESPLQTQLAQVISRGDKMDYTLQKATELGVTRITPLLAERSGVKLDRDRVEKRWQHWQRVIISACEQCGRNRLPVLNPVVTLAAWLPSVIEPVRLVLSPRSEKSLHDYPLTERPVVVLIGAEGGLSATDLALAQDFDFKPILLGQRVLRTETAALTALSLLQYRSGDL